ncbi:MAG: hypothetical protein FJ184_10180 [Gammaproteobacteria bacterium]|nr:hypothetical protein [Gammaproteobacteria bacterium]
MSFIAADSESLLKVIRWAQEGESAEVFGKIFIGSNASVSARSRSKIPKENIYENFEVAAYISQLRLDNKNQNEQLLKLTKEKKNSEENISDLSKKIKLKEDEERKQIANAKALSTEVSRLKQYQRSDRWKLSGFFSMGVLTATTIFLLTVYLSPNVIQKLLPAKERIAEQPALGTHASRGGGAQIGEPQDRPDRTVPATCEEGGFRPPGAQSDRSRSISGTEPRCRPGTQTDSESKRPVGRDGKTDQKTPTSTGESNIRPEQKQPEKEVPSAPGASRGSGRDRPTTPTASGTAASAKMSKSPVGTSTPERPQKNDQ